MHNTPQFYSKIEKQYRGVKKTTATPQPFMRPLYPRSFQSSRILDLTDDLMNMNTPWHFDRYLHIHFNTGVLLFKEIHGQPYHLREVP